jgi:hypothetical protein
VDVHEVESLSYGMVPSIMLGWWVSPEMDTGFEQASGFRMSNSLEESGGHEDFEGDA